MENNEFGMEAIISNGLGFSDSLFNTKKTNFDGDFDSMSLEIASTENLVNFAETYNQLEAYNADQKIKMLKKLHVHTRNVPGKYGKSVENFIIEQSLEEVATKGATNGDTSGVNPAKLPNEEIEKQRDGFLSKVWEIIKNLFEKMVDWIRKKIDWIRSKFSKSDNSAALAQLTPSESKDIWDSLGEISGTYATDKGDANNSKIKINEQSVQYFSKATKQLEYVGNILRSQSSDLEKYNNTLQTGNNSYDGFIRSINGVYNILKTMMPNTSHVPNPIKTVSKESLATFNKEFKNCLTELSWEHDPDAYAKVFTGNTCVKVTKDKHAMYKDIYGTDNISAIDKIISSVSEGLSEINTTLNNVEKSVNESDRKFQDYLKHKDRKFMNNSGELTTRETTNDSGNELIAYQWASITMTTFKMMNNIIKIAIKVVSIMSNTNKEVRAAFNSYVSKRVKIGGKKVGNTFADENGFTTNKKLDKDEKAAGKEINDHITKDLVTHKGAQKSIDKKNKEEYKQREKDYKEREKAENKAAKAANKAGKERESIQNKAQKLINSGKSEKAQKLLDDYKHKINKRKGIESWLLNPEDYI